MSIQESKIKFKVSCLSIGPQCLTGFMNVIMGRDLRPFNFFLQMKNLRKVEAETHISFPEAAS